MAATWARTQSQRPALKQRSVSQMWPILIASLFPFGNLLLIFLAFSFSGGLAPHKAAPSDDYSRGPQVGRTHPRVRRVWQRPEGDSGLQLRSLLSSAVGSSWPLRDVWEGLPIAKPAGREIRGPMREKVPRLETIRRRFKSQSHQSQTSRLVSMRLG